MIYSQLRENDRTARFEVKTIPGNRCELASGAPTSTADEAAPKSRAKKPAATAALAVGQTWKLADREEAMWLDLEGELNRITQRARIDLMLKGEGAETILDRLETLRRELYSADAVPDYLSVLGLLNIFEYFRLVLALRATTTTDQERAAQAGVIGTEYFDCRRMAIEMDIAQTTEWLVSHGVGLPDLTMFLPDTFGASPLLAAAQAPMAQPTAAAPAKKSRSKKKAAADEQATAESEGADAIDAAQATPEAPIPAAAYYVAELVRLHQATEGDLVRFVDDIQRRQSLASPREAIEKLRESVAPWIDPDRFHAMYETLKHEEARATRAQQAAMERQRELMDKRPRRGLKPKKRLDRYGRPIRERPNERNDRFRSPSVDEELDDLAADFGYESEDPNETFERAIELALERPEGAEFVPDEIRLKDRSNRATPSVADAQNADTNLDEPEAARNPARDESDDDHADFDRMDDDGEHESGDLFHEDEEDGDGMPRAPRPQLITDGRERHGDRPMGDRNMDRNAGDRNMGDRGMGDGPGGDRHRKSRRRRSRNRRGEPGQGPRNEHPVERQPREPREPREQQFTSHNPPPRKEKPRRAPKPGGGGSRQVDFDEVQPMSNASPGLPSVSVTDRTAAHPGAGGKPKRKWKGRR